MKGSDIMILDDSMKSIIVSWKASEKKKMHQDYNHLKVKVEKEFKKISKEELLNQSVEEVYLLKLFDKPGVPLSLFTTYPDFPDVVSKCLTDYLSDFYNETKEISEDGFNLMTYLEFLINSVDDKSLYWCSYPQISYDIMEEADTYYFTIIRFNAETYNKNLYYNGDIHPFIKSLNYAWMSNYNERTYDDAFRKATVDMNPLLGRTWDHLNILSTLKYEGSSNQGSILFYGDNQIKLLLEMETPVPLEDYRRVRKLLQISKPNHFLLVNDESYAIGFGYLTDDKTFYKVDFHDHLNWKMYLKHQELISCSNLLPQLPNIGNNVIKVRGQLKETFKGIDYDEDLIIKIIEAAKRQKKGTMIVVTEKAEEESNRLTTSSIKINPIQLDIEQILSITGIDGALIIDPYGYCHAIGSILDGTSGDAGDASRGARFNSALRYLSAQKQSKTKCLIAVISEDKYVDVIA